MPALKIFATQPIIIKDTCNLNINNLLNFFWERSLQLCFLITLSLGKILDNHKERPWKNSNFSNQLDKQISEQLLISKFQRTTEI